MLKHKATRAEITAERSLVLALEGGCRVPIGAVAHAEGNNLSLFGCIYSLNEPKKIVASAKGTLADAESPWQKSWRGPYYAGSQRL